MKSTLIKLALPAIAMMFAGTAHAASQQTNEALNLCKAHVKENFAEADRRKVQRIKTRRSSVEVNFAIREGEESFKGLCLVDNSGELTFTTDRTEVAAN